MRKINVLSLFDGMSVGRLALEKCGFDIKNYFASEIKPHAISVTQRNFPDTIQLGDVTKIKGDTLPQIDLLIGGSPCQDFSQANKVRSGLGGDKSGLFFEYLRLLKECKPKYFLLENVRMKPEHLELVNGYIGCEPTQINSKLVSAQLRNRYYWTNINDGNIDQPDDCGIMLNDILEYGYSDRIKSRCLLESDSRPPTTPIKMFHRYNKFNTLIFKDEPHYNACREHYDYWFKRCSAKQIDTNIVEEGIDLTVYDGIRYPNQNELEALQTIPNGYTKSVCRHDAASLLGDGWTLDVISHIIKDMVF